MSRVSEILRDHFGRWLNATTDPNLYSGRDQFLMETAAVVEAHVRRLAAEFAPQEDVSQRLRIAENQRDQMHARIGQLANDLVLQTATAAAASSLMLDMQKECIELRKFVEDLANGRIGAEPHLVTAAKSTLTTVDLIRAEEETHH